MTDRALLLSVAPEFAEKIAAGSKTVELRRRFPLVPAGTWIYFYATLPVGALVGRAQVVEIDEDTPSALWGRHQGAAGLSRERFDAYFASRDHGYAVRLARFEPLEALDLSGLRAALPGFVAPQSYRYLSTDQQASIGHGGDDGQ